MLVYLLLRTTRHKTQLVVSEILSPGANSNIQFLLFISDLFYARPIIAQLVYSLQPQAILSICLYYELCRVRHIFSSKNVYIPTTKCLTRLCRFMSIEPEVVAQAYVPLLQSRGAVVASFCDCRPNNVTTGKFAKLCINAFSKLVIYCTHSIMRLSSVIVLSSSVVFHHFRQSSIIIRCVKIKDQAQLFAVVL